jgi:hypothetical protein
MRRMRVKYEQKGVAMTCRSFKEYKDIFNLNDELLQKGSVLDVAAGASSFTKELNDRGYPAFAIDPLYENAVEVLQQRGQREIEESTRKLAQVSQNYSWDYYGSLEHHQEQRKRSLSLFIEDYERYKDSGRYTPATLPAFPFPDNTFSLILCSHFLFLYEEQFSFDFHYSALKELVRICDESGEIRIYPLVGFDGEPYKKLDELIEKLEHNGIKVEFVTTEFRFLKKASQIMKLIKQ